MSTLSEKEIRAQETVLACIKAINEEDFAAGRKQVHDHMKFVGVLGERDGGDAYFGDMEKMKLKYAIKKTFTEGDDVCLLYDLNMKGTIIEGCGLYHVTDGKIDHLKVIFDPRAVL
ncbi:MAG: nuclear transport factor 2 family protein [Mucilaginibacter polytrichastri]|nr:nuclear transport factor 2 family protein [Mucilaginibacter polytrichastri]